MDPMGQHFLFSFIKSPFEVSKEFPAQDSASLPRLASHLRGRTTAMVGLHLCGNLSVRAVELFEELLGDVWFSGYVFLLVLICFNSTGSNIMIIVINDI